MRPFKKLVFASFLFLLVLSVIVYYLHGLAIKNRDQARAVVGIDRNRMNPPLALSKLELAQKEWPFFVYDKDFQNLLNYTKEAVQRPAVLIYLKENTTEVDRLKIIEELRNVKGVKEVKFISTEDTFQRYKEINKDNPQLLNLVTPHILPASIEVYLDDYSIRGQIIKKVKEEPIVDAAL